MDDEEVEKIESDLQKKIDEDKKTEMPVSGRSVFDLQKLMQKGNKRDNK